MVNGWRQFSKGKNGEGYKKGNEKIDILYPRVKTGSYADLNIVNIYIDGDLEFEKEFKTKEKALSHAKAYMRSN